MRHAVSLALHAYWDSLRAGRPAPEMDDVDPAAMGALLPYTFVVEEAEGAPPRIRLSGTRLDALFGRDLRGTRFCDLWSTTAADGAGRALAAARGGLKAVSGSARGAPPDRAPADFEVLMLPFRDGRRVLCCLAAARVPGWSGLLPVAPLDLRDVRAVHGDDAPAVRPRASPSQQLPVARVAHLSVYAGGRCTERASRSERASSSARLNGSGAWWRPT